jgi:hypothetical protein
VQRTEPTEGISSLTALPDMSPRRTGLSSTWETRGPQRRRSGRERGCQGYDVVGLKGGYAEPSREGACVECRPKRFSPRCSLDSAPPGPQSPVCRPSGQSRSATPGYRHQGAVCGWQGLWGRPMTLPRRLPKPVGAQASIECSVEDLRRHPRFPELMEQVLRLYGAALASVTGAEVAIDQEVGALMRGMAMALVRYDVCWGHEWRFPPAPPPHCQAKRVVVLMTRVCCCGVAQALQAVLGRAGEHSRSHPQPLPAKLDECEWPEAGRVVSCRHRRPSPP